MTSDGNIIARVLLQGYMKNILCMWYALDQRNKLITEFNIHIDF